MANKLSINASHCSACDKTIIPTREICPYCGPSAGPMEIVSLDNTGSVLTYSVLHMPPEGFHAPLAMALVQLDQQAVVLCLGKSEEELKTSIGDSVTVSVADDGRFYFKI